MNKLGSIYNKVDPIIARTLGTYGLVFSRYSLALIFIWFGGLKLSGLSPAEDLVKNTVYWFDPTWFYPFLSGWEVLIGVCFLYRPLVRLGILLLVPHMAGTFLPLVLLPQVTFLHFPYALTLEGQYIVKNLIIIGAAMVIGARVRSTERV